MSNRPVRNRRPSTRLTDFVVPVGGVIVTPPRTQRQRRLQQHQQSPVEGAGQGDRRDHHVPGDQEEDQGDRGDRLGDRVDEEERAVLVDQVPAILQAGIEQLVHEARLAADGQERVVVGPHHVQDDVVQPPLLVPQVRVVRGVVGGEQEDLSPWLDPAVPVGGPVLADVNGWNRIDAVGGWECGLTGFNAMEQVPTVHKEKFARAFSYVLQQILEANSEESLTRGLKWFLVLPQALLRQSKRGGKKGQGAAWVSARFQAIVNEDWGKLLEMLEADKEHNRRREEARRRRRQRGREQEDRERKRETVLGLVAKGQVGRAARRISSFGVASVDNPAAMAALRAKYPDRTHPMPASVTKGQVVDNLSGLRDSLLSLEKGVSPGTGGCRPEYLTSLGGRRA